MVAVRIAKSARVCNEKQGRQISLAYQCWRMARRHLRPRIMGSSRCRGGVRVEWRPAKGTLAERGSGGEEGRKKRGFVTIGDHFGHPPPSHPRLQSRLIVTALGRTPELSELVSRMETIRDFEHLWLSRFRCIGGEWKFWIIVGGLDYENFFFFLVIPILRRVVDRE